MTRQYQEGFRNGRMDMLFFGFALRVALRSQQADYARGYRDGGLYAQTESRTHSRVRIVN